MLRRTQDKFLLSVRSEGANHTIGLTSPPRQPPVDLSPSTMVVVNHRLALSATCAGPALVCRHALWDQLERIREIRADLRATHVWTL